MKTSMVIMSVLVIIYRRIFVVYHLYLFGSIHTDISISIIKIFENVGFIIYKIAFYMILKSNYMSKIIVCCFMTECSLHNMLYFYN